MPIGPCRRTRAPPPGPVGQVARSETVIAFACLYLCGIETVVAFARWYLWWVETAIAFACLYLCGIETVIAFARTKWVFLVQFSGAVVMSVSAVPCWG